MIYTEMVYIFWTCSNREEAKKIARALLEKKLIACASILSEVESIYWWQGQLEEAKETKVILKTKRKAFSAIKDYILTHGSYEIAELSAIPIEIANPAYLSWLGQLFST